MKLLSLIALCLSLTVGSLQAQKTTQLASTTQSSISSDQAVKTFMQHLTQTYNLNNDQQFAVKKAGIALANNIRNAGKVNDKQRKNFSVAFNSTIMGILSQAQKEHYQQAGQLHDPKIEAIINAALSK
jgi:ABC-type enterochelin transport system substrate-binding protein